MAVGVMTRREQRADAGTVRATARDADAMSWVVEMYGMPLDLLRRRYEMSDSTARNMISRWRRAGWVETGSFGDMYVPGQVRTTGAMWIWATSIGIERFGAHPYAAAAPSAARVRHIRAAIVSRMYLERQAEGVDPRWVSERDLRWQVGRLKGAEAARVHMPDAEVEFNAPDGIRRRQAIEVELTPKTVIRTLAIMQQLISEGIGLDGAYRSVQYLVSREARPVVERAKQELPEGMQGRIVVRDLPEEV
jgi:hypothetical protein